MMAHVPVMATEVSAAFGSMAVPLRRLLDATLGAGGHSTLLAQQNPALTSLVGLDVDPSALRRAQGVLADAGLGQQLQTTFVRSNYAEITAAAATAASTETDGTEYEGILMDLGCSSMQLDEAGRGFSFMRDGPLDMRMGSSSGLYDSSDSSASDERWQQDRKPLFGPEGIKKSGGKASWSESPEFTASDVVRISSLFNCS